MLSGKVKGHAVLLGFNPVELARNTPIEGWPTNFQETAQKIAEIERVNGAATLLAPIVGPEPITGSTRMKSGSATKIVLEAMFEAAGAVDAQGADELDEDLTGALEHVVRILLAEYENATRDAYGPIESIAKLIEAGGETLRRKGHIYYIGATGAETVESGCGPSCDHDHEHETAEVDEEGHEHSHHPTLLRSEAGILGLIDASECPPTYGAAFEDVRGFLHGGWPALLPGAEVDLSRRGTHYQIGLEDFRSQKLGGLQVTDLVVALGNFPDRDALLSAARAKGAHTSAVVLAQAGGDAVECDILVELKPNLTSINADHDDENGSTELLSGPIQLAFKLVLNALTTGAHILTGKVYGNRMVDLRISNNKLFHRTVGIISDLMKVDQDRATEALLRSVYETDSLTEAQTTLPIRDHIETAKSVDKVVPKALFMATGQFSYKEATAALAENPVVRTAIRDFVANS
jgi:N-acetylmuramic acid 6-phosphate (MurNAc-6-P) etherase